MTYTAITAKNAADYPAGTRVRFDYGPMHGSEEGTITGFFTNEWGTYLSAVTDNGTEKTVAGLTTVGIGCYLI